MRPLVRPGTFWKLGTTQPIGLYLALVALTTWAMLTYGGVVPSYFLAAPDKVVNRASTLLADGTLVRDLAYSCWRIMAGFLLSVGLALPLGFAMGLVRSVEHLMMPVVSFVRYLPVPALIPFFILWIGVGEAQKITVVFVGVFFQLVVLVMDIVRATPREFVEVARTLGVDTRGEVLKVILPNAGPALFDAARVTVGWAWGWLILAELVGASEGLGYLILKSQRYVDSAGMLVGLLSLGVVGLIVDSTLARISSVWFSWRSSEVMS